MTCCQLVYKSIGLERSIGAVSYFCIALHYQISLVVGLLFFVGKLGKESVAMQCQKDNAMMAAYTHQFVEPGIMQLLGQMGENADAVNKPEKRIAVGSGGIHALEVETDVGDRFLTPGDGTGVVVGSENLAGAYHRGQVPYDTSRATSPIEDVDVVKFNMFSSFFEQPPGCFAAGVVIGLIVHIERFVNQISRWQHHTWVIAFEGFALRRTF